MNEHLRVLIVDDSEDDALLLADALSDSGYDVEPTRVDTPEAMRSALAADDWDLIIADYKMPRFSGPEALSILQETGLDVPFILVSGTAGDDLGVEMMHAGAQDFIVKDRLSRLTPAVARELTEAEGRKRRKAAEMSAKVSGENYRRMFESAPEAIITFDRDGVVTQVNPAFEELFGFSSERVVGKHIWETFGLPEDEAAKRNAAGRAFSGEVVKNEEFEDVRADGSHVWVLVSITSIYDELGGVTIALAMLTDITERKLAEQRRQTMEEHQREFYRRTILAATGGKLIIAEPDEILKLAGPPIRAWVINDLAGVQRARDEIHDLVVENGMDEQRSYDFVGCGVEALANVFKHAGGGCVTLHIEPDRAMLVASDEGPGIAALSLPDVALTKGYSTAESLGMGYKVMIEFADRVYLATSPEGTTVGVEMALRAESSPREAMLEKLSGW